MVPCVAVKRGRDHHHDDLTLQQRAAVCCNVVPRVASAAYSPCTTCRVPSLPTNTLFLVLQGVLPGVLQGVLQCVLQGALQGAQYSVF